MNQAIRRIHQALLTRRAGILLAGVLVGGMMVVAPAPVQAGTRFDLDVSIASSRCYEPVRRVWVEPVYRTITERIWVEPVYETRTERVWVEERVVQWSEITYGHGPNARVERVPYRVEPAHYETRQCRVEVSPGRWEERCRQVLVCAGYWKEVRIREPIIHVEGHYRDRDRHDGWRDDRCDDNRRGRDDDRRGGRRW
jgi:hypothetical protein